MPPEQPAPLEAPAPGLLRGALLLFGILAVVYAFSVDLRATRGASITADEPFYLLTTQSLIQDHDLDLTQQYDTESYRSFFDYNGDLWKQSIPNADGVLLSPHEPGLSVFLVPGFAIGGLRGAQIQMLLLTAATFALTFVLVASETRRPRLAWFATAAVALTATAFVYATEIYPEVPAAMLLVLGLLVVRRPLLGVRHALLLALCLSLLAWFGMKYVPLGCLVALYFVWRATNRGRITFLLVCAASGAAYVGLHLAIYDSLTAYNGNTVFEGAPTTDVLRAHFKIEDRSYRWVGLFIDRRFGIGRWAPVLLPVLPALVLLLRRSAFNRLALSLVLTQLFIATYVAITMMGWWFSGRTLVAVFPIFALTLAELLARLPLLGRIAIGALSAASMLFIAFLGFAAHAGDITLAVDPFSMPNEVFQRFGSLFPDYRAWGFDTVTRTVAWVSALLAVAVLLLRDDLMPQRPASTPAPTSDGPKPPPPPPPPPRPTTTLVHPSPAPALPAAPTAAPTPTTPPTTRSSTP